MSDYQPFAVELNLEDTEAWSGEARPLVPIGTYQVRVAHVEQKTGNGKPMISVTFEVVDGEQKGGKVYNNYMLGTSPGQARLKALMVACGAGLSRFNSDEIFDAQLLIDVVHTDGKPVIQPDGSVLPAKTFANAQNERPLPTDEAEPEPEPTPPPVTRTQAQGGRKAGAGAARRT